MLERLLNNILGLYTRRQYLEAVNWYLKKKQEARNLANALKASEEAKANALKEIEKLKLEIAKRVKRRRR